MKQIIFIFISFLLISCSNSEENKYRIDTTSYVAKNKDSRIKFIVLHYTATNDKTSIKVLTKENVSVHYLVTTKDTDPIYSLVPDTERAWHAGKSSFDERSNINDTSLGIEIVNLGYNSHLPFEAYNRHKELQFRSKEYYYEFTPIQIDKVASLILELKRRYNIPDNHIVAHSDIAPQRKQDPGPYFPWKLLYTKYGIGQWYNEADKLHFMNVKNYRTLCTSEIKQEFKKFGYEINTTDTWDDESRKVVYAFQMRFRPEKSNGYMDLETYAIIKALNKKYTR